MAAAPVEEILGTVLVETGYKEQFSGSENEEDQERLANIEELLTVAREFDERRGGEHSLEQFLEEASLTGETDDWESESDRVTLMTLHASKGLEFPVVFLVAAEQGLLPHERSADRLDEIEEERRLLFVGITRAMEELQISLVQYRDFRGRRRMAVPSPFLMELPRGEMEIIEHGPSADAAEAFAGDAAAAADLAESSEMFQAVDDLTADELAAINGPQDNPGATREPKRKPLVVSPLRTAAELANGGPLPATAPRSSTKGWW